MYAPEALVRSTLALTVRPTLRFTPLVAQRLAMEALSTAVPVRAGGSASVGGIPGEWHAGGAGRALLYFHGGGFSLGSPRTHRGIVQRLARALDAHAFVPAYRLAPEHPAPAAFEDAVAVYAALAAREREVIVAGDSAGGNMALSVAMYARDNGLPAPKALGLLCPWLDLVDDHDDTGDPLISPGRLKHWQDAYAPAGVDRRGVSPLYGDLDGLPPIVLHSAGSDPLLRDAERLAERVAVLEHRRHPGAFHGFHAFVGALARADQAVDALAATLRSGTL